MARTDGARRGLGALALALAAGLAACDGGAVRGEEPDGGGAAADAAADAAPDGLADDLGPGDAGPGDAEPGPDAGDVGADGLADGAPAEDTGAPGPDAAGEVDAAGDAADAAPDALEDAAPDALEDAAPDAAEDAAPDAAEDAAPDAADAVEPPPLFEPGALLVDYGAFPLGVQAGDPTHDAALLWTRYDGDAALRLVVLGDGAGTAPAPLVLDLPVDVAPGGFVQADATGLPPGTWLRYTFVETTAVGTLGARSPLGRFRTAPEPDALEAVVFGATSCINADGYSTAPLGRAAEDTLDFFVQAGDTVYADGAVTLDDYRAVWTAWYEGEDFYALHRATGAFATWDDHEVENNWNPETTDPAQIAAATQAWFEHVPTRSTAPEEARIWRSYRWGRALELFVLDCRSERLPSTRLTDDATYISPEQLAWLSEGLLASEAVFKVIVTSVPITNMPPIYVGADDRWEGYAAQREKVLDVVAMVDGVLFVAGDFHFSAIAGVEPPGDPLFEVPEVFVGPAAQFPNPLWAVLGFGLQKDQFSWLGGDNNYTRFIADPLADPPEITIEVVDGDGVVVHGETRYF